MEEKKVKVKYLLKQQRNESQQQKNKASSCMTHKAEHDDQPQKTEQKVFAKEYFLSFATFSIPFTNCGCLFFVFVAIPDSHLDLSIHLLTFYSLSLENSNQKKTFSF